MLLGLSRMRTGEFFSLSCMRDRLTRTNRWKGYEGALTLVGAVSTDLLEHVQEQTEAGQAPVFDLGQLFSSVVPTFLTTSGTSPFLASGRIAEAITQSFRSCKAALSSLRASLRKLFLPSWRTSTSTPRSKFSRSLPLASPSRSPPCELLTSASRPPFSPNES